MTHCDRARANIAHGQATGDYDAVARHGIEIHACLVTERGTELQRADARKALHIYSSATRAEACL